MAAMPCVIGYRAVMRDGTAGYGPTPESAVRSLKRVAPELRHADRTIESLLSERHPDLIEIVAAEPVRVVVL